MKKITVLMLAVAALAFCLVDYVVNLAPITAKDGETQCGQSLVKAGGQWRALVGDQSGSYPIVMQTIWLEVNPGQKITQLVMDPGGNRLRPTAKELEDACVAKIPQHESKKK